LQSLILEAGDEKREARKTARALRDGIGGRIGKSAEIVRAISRMRVFAEAETVFAYKAFGSEADLSGIPGRIVLPRVLPGGAMEFAAGAEKFRRGAFGILEPDGGEVVPPAPDDVVLVPGLAFDVSGGRLGYGGGYYDRYFADRRGAVLVGVCFAEQIVGRVPADAGDVRMDWLVTEKGETVCGCY
jgi:5-formyltetrahydrofolate cyclo-ligase